MAGLHRSVRRGSAVAVFSLALTGLGTAALGGAQQATINYNVTDLGTLGGTNGFPQGIDPFGQVVGQSYLSGNNTERAFLYDGLINDLGTIPTGNRSSAAGINGNGLITGYSATTSLGG